MKKVLLFLIIICAFFLRIYHGVDFFFWQSDEDIIALTVKKILVNHDPQLIGFPIPGGFYLGPLIFYILSFFYAIAFMDPMKFPFMSALIGTAVTFGIYKVGKTIFEKESIGIIAAVIYAFSYLTNVYSRILTGLTFAPILTLLVYLILHQNLKSGGSRNLIWLGLILTVASQNEGSSISLILLTIVIWFLFRFRFARKKFVQVIGIFLLFHVPLLVFELKHNFFLSHSALMFLTRSSPAIKSNTEGLPLFNPQSIISAINIFPQVISRLLFVFGPKSIGGQILPCEDLITLRENIAPVTFFLSVVIFGYFVLKQVRKRKTVYGEKIVFVHLLIMFCGVIIYNLFMPSYFFEWITVIFFPGIVFIIAYFLDAVFSIKHLKLFAILFLVIFIFYNVKFLLSTRPDFGLGSKSKVVEYALSETGQERFYLESIGSCNALGYLYLFWYQGHLPEYSYGLVYQLTPTLIPAPEGPRPNKGVVIVNKSLVENKEFFDKYAYYKSRTKSSKKIDGIEVLIVEDK